MSFAVRSIGGGVGYFQFVRTISSDITNYNLRSQATAAGWDGIKALQAYITINSGVVISANNTSVHAFDSDSTAYPYGSTLELINNGYIIGMGGAGNGGAGGPAFHTISSLPVTINNASGVIGGGGGGGGSSGQFSPGTDTAGGGGGRSGRTNSAGGSGNRSNGSSGTFSASGSGGSFTDSESNKYTGASGGQWGAAGDNGNIQNGGAGGRSVDGNAYVTWKNVGARYGATDVADNPPETYTLILSVSEYNPDIYSRALSGGWDGISHLPVSITALNIGGLTVSGSYPNGIDITISSLSKIYGVGGLGDTGASGGSNGGTALTVTTNVTIANYGTIAGGGGGGGMGGGAGVTNWSGKKATAGGGSGGNGAGWAQGDTPDAGVSGDYSYIPGSPGVSEIWARGGAGGSGGTLGNAGSGGASGSVSSTGYSKYTYPGKSGGAGGAAVVGNSYITWTNTGTRIGAIT